jgi:IclR family transcriptional regulator, KDG regulon repressor
VLNKLNQVLSLFTSERSELTALEAAELLKWSRSTVYRVLAKIHDEGFLAQDAATGRYRLGMRLATLGELARQSTSLQQIALPILRDLSDRSGETADLTVLVGPKAVTIEVVESYQAIMLPGLLGREVPLYATAAGKMLLAWRTREAVERMVPEPLHRFTRTTITDFEAFLEELERSRERGYAVANGEWIKDLVSVGAEVRNHRGEIAAAVAMGGPRSRMTSAKREEAIEAVVEAGRQLSVLLGHTPGDGSGAGVSRRDVPTRDSA